MMAEPIKVLELYYLMIQFLINPFRLQNSVSFCSGQNSRAVKRKVCCREERESYAAVRATATVLQSIISVLVIFIIYLI